MTSGRALRLAEAMELVTLLMMLLTVVTVHLSASLTRSSTQRARPTAWSRPATLTAVDTCLRRSALPTADAGRRTCRLARVVGAAAVLTGPP